MARRAVSASACSTATANEGRVRCSPSSCMTHQPVPFFRGVNTLKNSTDPGSEIALSALLQLVLGPPPASPLRTTCCRQLCTTPQLGMPSGSSVRLQAWPVALQQSLPPAVCGALHCVPRPSSRFWWTVNVPHLYLVLFGCLFSFKRPDWHQVSVH